jgi:ankyrin repeat protein
MADWPWETPEEELEPIINAAYAGNLEEVRRLLQQKPQLLEATRSDWSSPLVEAAECGHLDIVRFLLDQGADVNRPSGVGWVAIEIACWEGRVDVVLLLIERGADPFEVINGDDPAFFKAVNCGQVAVVEALLKHACRDDASWRDFCRYLIDSTDGEGNTALQTACNDFKEELVRLLLEAGADPTIANKHGDSPLDQAKYEGEEWHEFGAMIGVRTGVRAVLDRFP